ncbi:transmembrane amino acid transporter protein-domain-containing protein [Gorgonomyces haynaldii]|nr:transmembrane amino acid transporter protein-domain-containing protein [Gorgonomyces haynaldii]
MPQDYVQVPQEDVEEGEIVEEHTVYTGTVLSSCINLANTILGSGMLAMPSAFAATGMGLGILMVLFCALCSGYGLVLLTRVASQVGRKSSFFACAKVTYPNAAIYFDLAIAVKCFGVSISYLVICGDLLPQVMHGFFPFLEETSFLRTKFFWTTVCLIGIAPANFMSKLDSLRYTSAFALSAVFYLLFVVIVFFISPPDGMPQRPALEDIVWFQFDTKLVSFLPIFVFAFTCHQNIFSIYNELEDNSAQRVESVVHYSIGASYAVYETIGIIGYLTFGSLVGSNIIAMYPPSGLVTGGQLAIALLVILSYPLQCHPCRNSCYKVYTSGSDEPMSNTFFRTCTVFLMVLSWVLAISVKNLSTVLSVVGATGSTTICYILPGISIDFRLVLLQTGY